MKKTYSRLFALIAFAFISLPMLALTPNTESNTGRPDHVNNGLKKYFPPIIVQAGGSCGSAASIYYQMSYEFCSFRNLDASLSSNRFPTHFTWLHTNSKADKENIAIYHGVPSVATYGGDTYSLLFGNQDCSDKDFAWMQGYDKWYSAMFNRLSGRDDRIPHDLMTEEGREELKNYLWNHWGDPDFYGGGVVGIGVASAVKAEPIASTPINDAIGVVGKYYLYSWGSAVDHALTIVGYDDRIEFDLDGNGVYGEEAKDEKGAWIIANSWGDSWRNSGFIYCPYKISYSVGTSSNVLQPNRHFIRKNYTPQQVLKVKMDFSHRSALGLSTSVVGDTTVKKPTNLEVIPFINYAGDGTNSSTAPEVPMLGKWQSEMKTEPMEFGYDVTDQASQCDPAEPRRYFFKASTKGSLGKGNIYSVSLMDYSLDEKGMEMPAQVDSVIPLQASNSALVVITTQGNQIFAPLSPALNGTNLTWQQPKPSSYELKSYTVYKDGAKYGTYPKTTNSITVDNNNSTYTITATYLYKNSTKESLPSAKARQLAYVPSTQTDNNVLKLENGSFTAPGVFKNAMQKATIEFWIKPSNIGINQTIGTAWGGFTIQSNAKGVLSAGWSNTDRVQSSVSAYKKDTWSHIAVSVDGSSITVYVNGVNRGTHVSSKNSGIPAIGDLIVGNEVGAIEGQIDELRVWNTCRDVVQVYNNRKINVLNPAIHSDLVCYYTMDVEDGVMRDLSSGNTAEISGTYSQVVDNSMLTGPLREYLVNVGTTKGNVYTDVAIPFTATTPVHTTDLQWTAEGATPASSQADTPTFTFSKPGKYAVTLVANGSRGESDTITTNLDIQASDKPKANFVFSSDTISLGDPLTLANYSTGNNTTFKWLAPGSDQEEYYGVNGLLTYPAKGKYEVTLIASNSSGEDRMTKTLYVVPAPPKCDMEVYPNIIYKGETAYLNDLSKYDPTSWKWQLTNGIHGLLVDGQNSSITPTNCGVYDVTLTINNANGTASKTQKSALVVCNENSYSGLKFTGKEYIQTITSPIATETKAFTIEWWMYPNRTEGALSLSTTTNAFSFSCDDNGRAVMTMGDDYIKLDQAYPVANQWHHYALTYASGKVCFYRDGELVANPSTTLGSTCPAWGNLIVGVGESMYFRGIVDEFRVWDKALSANELAAVANQTIKNPDDATKNANLVLYYDFNQNGGDVIDRTSHGINAKRYGFGPDGDAWGLSQGVFSLDLDKSNFSDVTSKYLTNYKAPFLYDITTVNSMNSSAYKKLLQNNSTSKWKLENTLGVYTITGAYVDRNYNDVLAVTTSYDFFSYQLSNHLCYQTVNLPQGVYTLTVEPGTEFQTSTSVLLANEGSKLAGNSTYRDEALAYSDLRNKTITFFVDKPKTVSLGFIFNMSGQQKIQIKSIKLEKSDLTVLEADGITNVYDAVESAPEKWATGGSGVINVVCKDNTTVKIYTIDGRCVFNDEVEGVHSIPMPAGIYIVNGQKVTVR